MVNFSLAYAFVRIFFPAFWFIAVPYEQKEEVEKRQGPHSTVIAASPTSSNRKIKFDLVMLIIWVA